MLQVEKPTAQKYFEKNFQNPELEWKNIYTLPRHVTINTNLHIFQCKLLRNILYLNEMLYKSGKTGIDLFLSCTNFLWKLLQHSFQNALIIPPITPKSAIFGFTDYKVNYHLINHILTVSKYYVYKTRGNGLSEPKVLKRNIHKMKNIEKQISLNKLEK